MAELKTQKNDASVSQFLEGVADPIRREESQTLLELMQAATGEQPAMWGDAIIGFGDLHLHYASGRELDWFKVGFSPRKQALTLYLSQFFAQETDLLKRLGRYKAGKGCLYLPRLAEVDLKVLGELIQRCAQHRQD